MATTNKIEAWERKSGLMLLGGVSSEDEVSEEEFSELMAKNGFHGVDFEGREKFLKDNGHEVNRKNMLDATLDRKK